MTTGEERLNQILAQLEKEQTQENREALLKGMCSFLATVTNAFADLLGDLDDRLEDTPDDILSRFGRDDPHSQKPRPSRPGD